MVEQPGLAVGIDECDVELGLALLDLADELEPTVDEIEQGDVVVGEELAETDERCIDCRLCCHVSSEVRQLFRAPRAARRRRPEYRSERSDQRQVPASSV